MRKQNNVNERRFFGVSANVLVAGLVVFALIYLGFALARSL
jgi:hypothetical protein